MKCLPFYDFQSLGRIILLSTSKSRVLVPSGLGVESNDF